MVQIWKFNSLTLYPWVKFKPEVGSSVTYKKYIKFGRGQHKKKFKNLKSEEKNKNEKIWFNFPEKLRWTDWILRCETFMFQTHKPPRLSKSKKKHSSHSFVNLKVALWATA